MCCGDITSDIGSVSFDNLSYKKKTNKKINFFKPKQKKNDTILCFHKRIMKRNYLLCVTKSLALFI